MTELLADPRLHPRLAHWLPFAGARAHPFDEASMRFTFDGQGALSQLFRMLRDRLPADARVLVPAFHCPTVVEPIIRAGFPLDFYEVRADLRRPLASWESLLSTRPAVVVVINYFGFDFDLEGLNPVPRERRPIIVEDCCHSFLKGEGDRLAGGRGDYSIFSFKKLVPCLTGGGIRRREASLPLPAVAASAPMGALWQHLRKVVASSLSGGIGASLLDGLGTHKVTTEALAGPVSLPPLDQVYPFVPALSQARMPFLAKRILRHSRLSTVAALRRRFFKQVADSLAPLRECLPQPFAEDLGEACPWGYPVLIPERARHDYRLRNLGVPFFTFGEQLHPSVDAVLERFPQARQLRDSMLFLPVHQQLTENQVADFCARLVDYVMRQAVPQGE